jgi:hypothetical protein
VTNVIRVPATFIVGVDLGQTRDHTAVVILQRTGDFGETISLRHAERIPLGVSYLDQAQHLAGMVAQPQLAGRCRMGVDATGVGPPVIEMLRPVVGCPLTPVIITAGRTQTTDTRQWRHVPKRDLIAGALVSMEKRYMRISRKMPFAALLTDELAAYRVKISADSGHDSYANDAREAEHDDLVLAFAIAVFLAQGRGWGKPIRPRPNTPSVNPDLGALQADPSRRLDDWAAQPPGAQPAAVGTWAGSANRDPLAGWWNE